MGILKSMILNPSNKVKVSLMDDFRMTPQQIAALKTLHRKQRDRRFADGFCQDDQRCIDDSLVQKDGGETSGCESDSHHCGQCDVLQIEAGEEVFGKFEN